ncbi:MAG: ABC transporter permease [Actinobacteria bacterium]|nr:ABC transporter permease [Actinomycetota bacterium]MCL5070781.1 ABC transporter permease [Actinomycetota bacterium]
MDSAGKENIILGRAISLIVAFIIAFTLTSIVVYFSGFNVLKVFWIALTGGFGSIEKISLSLNEAAPLLFCTLAYIVAFKSGVWNIGAEGQLFVGAIGAALAGIYIQGISKLLHIIIIITAGFVFGAFWGFIPGILKSKFKTNEIITSLLMNFIGVWLVSYIVRFPLQDPDSFIAVTQKIQNSARLPLIITRTSMHIGIIIGATIAIIVWFIFQYTVFGYRLKITGTNPLTARFGGIAVDKMIVITMIISGGIAGLAGTVQVTGVHFLLAEFISPAHYGFFAIPLVFITRLNPFAAIVASIFFGGLLTGSKLVQMTVGIDPNVITIFVSLIMLSLMLDQFIEKRILKLFKKV